MGAIHRTRKLIAAEYAAIKRHIRRNAQAGLAGLTLARLKSKNPDRPGFRGRSGFVAGANRPGLKR
jgi:hypothetical protein